MDHFELLREIWPLLRASLLDPIEILPNIRGLTDNDVEGIKAAMNTSKIAAIDRLYEALRRRDKKCFHSFLSVLWNGNYRHLANEIMGIGQIPEQYLGIDTRLSLQSSEDCTPRGRDNIAPQLPQESCSWSKSSSTPRQSQSLKDQACSAVTSEEPLSRGMVIRYTPKL